MHYLRSMRYEGHSTISEGKGCAGAHILLSGRCRRGVGDLGMNKLLAALGILVIAGGLFLLVAPVSHIPLLDANRQVLAESERQAYCAGEVMVETQGRGSEEAMADCIASSTVDNEIDHSVVQPAFCAGILSKYNWSQSECIAAVEEQEIWPTMKGTWTNSWNKRFPYPISKFGRLAEAPEYQSRTGDRETTDREGFDRDTAPTSTTTEESAG